MFEPQAGLFAQDGHRNAAIGLRQAALWGAGGAGFSRSMRKKSLARRNIFAALRRKNFNRLHIRWVAAKNIYPTPATNPKRRGWKKLDPILVNNLISLAVGKIRD
jgi:hypothetical protein